MNDIVGESCERESALKEGGGSSEFGVNLMMMVCISQRNSGHLEVG